MNEYQAALDRIALNYGLSSLEGETDSIMDEKFNNDIKLISELVNKRTPMKPVGEHTHRRCGRCNTRVRSGQGSSSRTRDTICRECFQVIDWEDNL